jgi:hypothetical protein
MKEHTNIKQPQILGDSLRLPYTGKQIERKLLNWLRNYHESLMAARPYDKTLSQKLDCIIYLIEN